MLCHADDGARGAAGRRRLAPQVVEAAVTAATAALVAAVHRPERREALGAAVHALRQRCGGAGAGSGTSGGDGVARGEAAGDARARVVEVIASVAVRAAGPPPPLAAEPDRLGTVGGDGRQET